MITVQSFLFHYRKHHLSELRSHAFQTSEEDFRLHLVSLGQSMFDLYLGKLSSEQIKSELENLLQVLNINTESDYHRWLENHEGFRLLPLSDTSTWTLRYLPGETFVHVHPARYSPHTQRIKAQHLKQALWLLRHQMDATEENIACCRKALEMSPTGNYELTGLKAVVELLRT